jgi:hypothetical protein
MKTKTFPEIGFPQLRDVIGDKNNSGIIPVRCSSWYKGIAEGTTEAGQAGRANDRVLRILEGWPRSRAENDLGYGVFTFIAKLFVDRWAHNLRVQVVQLEKLVSGGL